MDSYVFVGETEGATKKIRRLKMSERNEVWIKELRIGEPFLL